ncbi:MAG: glutamate racemase [Thermodesulfovibrionales bacterium]|nr:glutamate racemase [Thermodesulfovibrionales bacterium]
MSNSAPIGVFDSGIGGLTVVSELMRLMPGEDIVYLGDTARVPYGVRSPDTVRRYAAEGASFLRDRGIKFLVVACNTVSAVGLDEVARHCDVPLVGVIEPGARAAVAASKAGHVGVIGTEATITSRAYVKAINDIDSSVKVHGNACPLFVPLAEEGWTEGEVPRLAAERYLEGLKAHGIDVLVLGCTHYPLLRPMLALVMGKDTSIIDSASETAREVRDTLEKDGLANEAEQGRASFFVTDSPEKFQSVGERFLKHNIKDINKVVLKEVC